MNGSFTDGVDPVNYVPRIREVERWCRAINKKFYFKYALDSDHAFVWTRRRDSKRRLQLCYLDAEGKLVHEPFEDVPGSLIEKYIYKLNHFMDEYKEYAFWQKPTSWS